MHPFAYSIADAVRVSGIGRTKLFDEIRTGRLTARKFGSRTLILAEDLKGYLQALPQSPGTANSVAGLDSHTDRIVYDDGERSTTSKKRGAAR